MISFLFLIVNKIVGYIKDNLLLMISVIFIIMTIKTIPVIICKGVFSRFDLANVIVIIYGFTYAIVSLFKRCYKTNYSYKNRDFIFDLAKGLIIAKLVVLYGIFFGLIGLMFLASMFPSVMPYYITLLEQYYFTQLKIQNCALTEYTMTPYTPVLPGVAIPHYRIYPHFSEDLWRSYANGKLPCLWHMVSIPVKTDLPYGMAELTTRSNLIVVSVTWEAFNDSWKELAKNMKHDLDLHLDLTKMLQRSPSLLNAPLEYFINHTQISVASKDQALLLLDYLNKDNLEHTTLGYNSKPFVKRYTDNTTFRDL